MTGLGAIAATGATAQAVWQSCREGRVGVGPISGIPTERLSVRLAAQITGYDPAEHFPARRLALLDRATQLALVVARQAAADADLAGLDPRRAGAILGSSIGQETNDSAYFLLYGQNAARLPPLTVPRLMPSAPASQVSMEFGLRGATYCVSSACASAAHAIGQAAALIRDGRLDLALAGGADAPVVVGALKAWEGLRVLSADACRPFSRDRTGLVVGEGAGMLLLEAWDRARARGATILAELVGFGMGADAADITAPDVEGAAWAIAEALRDAALPPGSVDYICAHGTGTRLNDRTESQALARVFGAHLPRLPVSAAKSMLGHTMTACGALAAVLTVCALRDGVIPPTMGYREADPECSIDCVPNAAREAPMEVALSNSFAFGGLNAVLAFRRV